MLTLMLFAALPTLASPPLPPVPPTGATSPLAAPAERPKCANLRPRYAGQGSAQARRLDELPPGQLELTVYREVAGCPIPAVIRDNIAPQADAPGR